MDYVKYIREMVGHKPIILVGSVTILHKNNQILLQKRKGSAVLKWGLPGGLMEMGESAEETARREIYEETQLKVGTLNLVDVHSGSGSFIKVHNGDEFYSVSIAYETEDFNGILKIDKKESLDFKYFPFEDLPKNMVGSHMTLIQSFLKKR
ncbi:MAG: NUDIX hydrolase [Clostridiales bacterium]|nr:NUDIX hydrolase [Clostridiales bacterium]